MALEYVPNTDNEPIFEAVPLDAPQSEENGGDSLSEWRPDNDMNEDVDDKLFTGLEKLISLRLQLQLEIQIHRLCQICGNEPTFREPETPRPAKKRTRSCGVVIDGQKCPIPETCLGRQNQLNFILRTKGDESKIVHQTIKKRTSKRCELCGRVEPECPGVRNRSMCAGTRN